MSGEHRLTQIEAVRRDGFVSHCSCGWRSPPFGTAGMAGSKHTQHEEEAASLAEAGERRSG